MLGLEAIYGCVRQNLLDRREHVARIVGGAACEQWFSSEVFVALNWPTAPVLNAGLCGHAEHRKRDLAIRDSSDRTVMTVESKVIHNNKNLWKRLRELRDQVVRECYSDEVAACARGGLVYVVWGDYFTRREVKSLAEYHAVVLAEIDHLFPSAEYTHLPADGLDEIVPATELPWPGGAYRVALHMKFVQRR